LQRHLEQLAQLQASAGDWLAQRVALDELRGDEMRAARLPDFVNGDDVRVVERRGGLLLEAADPVGVPRELRGQHLEGDLAPEATIQGDEDLTHPALAERGENFVAVEPVAGDDRSGLLAC